MLLNSACVLRRLRWFLLILLAITIIAYATAIPVNWHRSAEVKGTIIPKMPDMTPPSIANPYQNPESDEVMSDQPVKVSVEVIDAESGVRDVTLFYTIDDSVTWLEVLMSYNVTSALYDAIIHGYPYCTLVAYKIVAYDNAGNPAVNDNTGQYFVYHVQRLSFVLMANIDFYPQTLNLQSIGKWITAHIELPEGYSIDDINVSSMLLNSTVSTDLEAPILVGDYDGDGIIELMVTFNRTLIVECIAAENVEYSNVTLILSGKLWNETAFEGSCTLTTSAVAGDANCDGIVDIYDIVESCVNYGSKEGTPNWNANANFAPSWDQIDIFDIVTIICQFTKT